MSTQPNILFIQVDQLNPHSLAAYGNQIVKTPHIDALAATGAVFETVYCNFPLCAPSRFSMATGSLCSVNGAFDNAADMSAEFPTYAHYLRQRGYQTALSGKMHFIGPDQYHGFERRLTPDLYPADFSWVPNWADEGDRDTNDPQSVLVAGVCERSVQIDFDEDVCFQAKRHLYDIARSPDDRPFFLQVSFTHPHEPYLCTRPYWDLYDGADIPLPDVGALPAGSHDAHSVRILQDFGMLDYRFSDEDIIRARRAHYGAVSYIDSLIGQIIQTLKSTGAYDNTVIIFTADHGEFLGERGMWFKKHFFEPSLRVPLIMAAPWITPQRITECASLVDMLPTFAGLAQGALFSPDSPDLEGEDLNQYLGARSQTAQRAIYAEYLAEAALAPIFMIRKGRYKFISSPADPELLFDLDADPHERMNLASEADYEALVTQFQAEVRAKWDAEELTDRILASQRRRLSVQSAHGHGIPPRWNHGEKPGEPVKWYRGEQGYSEWAFDYLPEASSPHPL